MKLAFQIAFRFLKSSKGQTILIALGIAIGVSVQIFIGLLIQGLQKSLVDTTIGSSSQITVSSQRADRKLENWEDIYNDIKVADSRIINLKPVLDSSAFIRSVDKTEPVLVRGFLPEKADKIYRFNQNIYEGKFPALDNEVILGKELRETLKTEIGDVVEISTPTGESFELKVTGFYDLKVSTINKSWIIVNISTAQNIFDFEENITSIEMQVTDVFSADEIANIISKSILEEDVLIEDWKSLNQQLLSGLSGQSVSSIMIQVFVLVSVVLAISSVLAISVLQKSKQIGILKAMGLKDKDASAVFMFQGLLLGIVGSILGILIGILLLVSFSTFAVDTEGLPIVNIYFNYSFIAFSGIIAILSSTLASLIPAIKSLKLSPMEVIRNG